MSQSPTRPSSPERPTRTTSTIAIAGHPVDLSVYAPGIVTSPDLQQNFADPQTPRIQLPQSAVEYESGSPSRPTLGSRSISSPHVPLPPSGSGTLRRHSRVQPSHGWPRSPPRPSPPEQQWSLFGQMMENEGQIRLSTSGTQRLSRRRPPALASSVHTLDTSASGLRTAETRVSGTSITESPATDALMNTHYFTPSHSSEAPEPDSASDSDYDSDDSRSSTSDTSTATAPADKGRRWLSLDWLPSLQTVQRNIIKCAIAYFVASLFTFVAPLSRFLSAASMDGEAEHYPSPSAHMVATVSVYFNPAKTFGAMAEADAFCLLGLVWACFVCLGANLIIWGLEREEGLANLADVLVIIWIGLGMCGVAWMKVWMAKPSFNTACSMTTIVIFVVVVREGGLEQLVEVAFIVLMGVIVSNAVCFLFWPQTATRSLQANMTKTLDSFSTLLTMLTNSFLLEDALHQPSHERLQKAVENHQASFTSLKKNLAEARSERLLGGPAGERGRAYEDAVDSLNRLAQHLNGLRSSTRLQYELSKAHSDGKVVLRNRTRRRRGYFVPAESVVIEEESPGNGADKGLSEADRLLKAAAAMFGDLVEDLGPPLKALSHTCTTSFRHLREAFVNQQGPAAGRKAQIHSRDFHELAESIERALFTFDSTSNQAVMRLYRRGALPSGASRASFQSATEDGAENGMLTAGNNEHVFLTYFFIFTLQEFANELISLVDAMGRIYTIERAQAARAWWPRRAYNVVRAKLKSLALPCRRSSGRKERQRKSLHRRLSEYVRPPPTHHLVSFPKIRPHAPNTIQTPAPSQLPFFARVKRRLWALGAMLQERDTRYAIKAGMATAILAAPAFFESTRPVFVEWKGEWALISFFVVMSPTIGATNFLSWHRVLGTFVGAVVAIAVYILLEDYPIVMAVFGFFFSIPWFYLIVAKPQYASSGRFGLLTYNLTCLYCYNIRQRHVPVQEIGFHRFVSVAIGVLWAAFISRFWWPAEARRELSRALGEFCLNIGWLYTRLVASNSFAPEALEITTPNTPAGETETSTLIARQAATTKLNNSIHEFMAMEHHLQIKLIELQGLLAQTQHEPRLKGPFPVPLYRTILTSLQTILDKLHSMRCVTTREEWYTSVRKDFIIPVNRERQEMVGNIILYFSTLSSAFRLKAPLPPYLPQAERARQRLVEAIRNLDVVKNRDVKGSRHLLFFAYALTMQGVTQELEKLGGLLQDAFGVIGQTPEEFDALFRQGAERASALV